MLPSAREVEEVVVATLKGGNWARAAMLLAGAVKLSCTPTARTYAEVVTAVSTRSTWKVTVQVLDQLQTSPLSARAVYHTAADAILARRSDGAAETLLALILAARRRRVPVLAPHHHLQCSRLLLDAGDWRGALLVGSQERLIQHAPTLAWPTMLAAAAGRQWVAGSKIMSLLLASGGVPSKATTESFIRCFTVTSPWWRALAVASVLTCRDEPEVRQRAWELREEVRRHAESELPEIKAREERRQALLHVADCRQMPDDLTLGEVTEALVTLKERQWERALELVRLFPALLELTPRPRALLSPMARLNTVPQSSFYWEALWQTVSASLTSAPMVTVLHTASLFLVHLRSGEEHDIDTQTKVKEVTRAKNIVIDFVNVARTHEVGVLDPACLHSVVRLNCTRGCWEDALALTGRPTVVFTELAERGNWQAAVAVYGGMHPSAQERAGPPLEHLFISMGLWMPALRYAQSQLPRDTLRLRSLAIPLCAALGQWRRALHMLFRHVPTPTAAETRLQRYCILRHVEATICEAVERDDWEKALQAWAVVCRIPHHARTPRASGESAGAPDGFDQFRIRPNVVKCTAKLLLEHQRYDACCLVLSLHTPTAADPILLRCFQLFYHIRLSPLSYGRVLQQYRETYAAHRVVLDCYAVLALSLSGNHLGAFWILRGLSLLRDTKAANAVVRGLEEVPHVKKMLASILLEAATPSQTADVEAVVEILTPCVKSIEDVNLFNRPLLVYWESDSDALRACAVRMAIKLLQHMMQQELPAPWVVLRVVAGGIERHTESSAAHLLYEALRQRATLGTAEQVEGDAEGKGESWRPSQKERDAFFRRCAQSFLRMGHWGRALAAMQACEKTDEMALFQAAVLLKEENESRVRAAHRVILEATATDDTNTGAGLHSLVPGRQVEEVLVALTHLQAWKAALVVFNSVMGAKGRCSRGAAGRLSSGVANALLSTVATFGSWEVALRLLTTVQQEFSPVSALMEKGLTDVLRSVRSHSGAVMCSKVMLFIVQEMGAVPTPTQYEVLLSSCLGSRLAVVERDACASNLRRLSHSLSERQVIDLIVAITTAGRSWEEAEVGARSEQRQRGGARGCSHPTCWIPVERPPLTGDELHHFSQLAPRIVLSTSRGLEALARAFSGRFRPFELKLLLQHYRTEVLERVRETDSGVAVLDTQLVEYCRENRFLHILLLSHERVWQRPLLPVVGQGAAAFIERLTSDVFHGFASPRTVAAVWEACYPYVAQLAARRWPWLCEYELLRAVRRSGGRPPAFLRTRPDASRAEIASYWATYGRAIWPELFFSGPELCQLAVYVPLVEQLLGDEQGLRELCFGIEAAHFSAEAIPHSEELLRQPRSARAIRAVFNLAFKSLKRLHMQLDLDARGGRFYYHHHPDVILWQRYSAGALMAERLPRWALALRIIHHYRRSTATTLPPRMLAALFSACAADAAESVRISQQKEKQPWESSFWELAIQCTQAVEPNCTPALWHHAIQLALLSKPSGDGAAMAAEECRLAEMHDASLQATTRVVLSHAKRANGTLPFRVSLLLIDQMKALIDEVRFHDYARDACSQGDDALTVWALLQEGDCLQKMEPQHAVLLRRLVLEGGGGPCGEVVSD
ncbi:putative NADH-dependent fumarate reductase [Trypanosoma rangeli]|uniref:Putative NADH-dependent fumarate reductase n=1 Tax=Trypanosoma rangeli TaxID=5698 RepID=A0A422NNH3_TRYRA|nr:putative NADH-dependent fumarate reductase [Trypanosoma rangeli]RNF06919.1 putative NADH-dependent fumarate reductase [Trypanosoma rangeli]|eukprot:RNF06919.1 putative NADH-dependent fumarate reductase [Trypanosoma rangeli]